MAQTLTLYDQVLAAYRATDFAAVDRLMEPAISSGAVDIRLVEILAATRMHQGRFGDAEQLFRGVIGTNGPASTTALNLATALYKQGKASEAHEWAGRAAELDDNLPDAHLLAAITTMASSPVEVIAAQNHLKKVTQLRPDYFDGHFQLARYYSFSGNERDAEGAYRRALEINADAWAAHEGLATMMLEQGRPEEALAAFERALELNPQAAISRVERDRLRSARTGTRERLARYPRAAKEFSDIDAVIDKYLLSEYRDVKPFISATTPVFTLGSCFALNVARALESFGVPTISVPYPEEINNTFANRLLLEWVVDANAPGAKPYDEHLGADQREHIIKAIRQAKAVIVSLGVAPAFFDSETGELALTFGTNFMSALASTKYTFRTPSVQEVVDNVKAMIGLLRTLNAGVPVVLTVSPVPMRATFERQSAVIADCVSKATLRVAAHELMQSKIDGLIYWPSFEAVRWFGGHTDDPVFGTDDGCPQHVSQALIAKIMYAFVRIFGRADLVASAEAKLAASA